ncbi:MAG: ribosome small subunit-dependent GTPase A [Clostridia bacterium]|nr:ribosome small subunit-dependent GTPase A [Clostridia bacterium]
MDNTNNNVGSPCAKSATGRIVKGVGGLYTVVTDENPDLRITANAKGTFRHEKITPSVGDRVTFEYISEDKGFITDIMERKNILIRPACANVDCLVITACAESPKADLYMLDKLSAVATYNGISVLFVFNKCDIAPADELIDIYSRAGFEAIALSAASTHSDSEEINRIKDFVKDRISFFAGASGVGKSSLMNLLFPGLSLATGGLSRKISRGKHTTRASELYRVDDISSSTYIADTPGFSSFEVAQLKLIPKEHLLEAFPEIYAHSDGCVYKDCTHTGEGSDVCSVKKAVEDGIIPRSRHESFVRLYGEISAIKPWD